MHRDSGARARTKLARIIGAVLVALSMSMTAAPPQAAASTTLVSALAPQIQGVGTISGPGAYLCTNSDGTVLGAVPCPSLSLDLLKSTVLTATAGTNYTFSSWQNCASPSGSTCTVPAGQVVTSLSKPLAVFTLATSGGGTTDPGTGTTDPGTGTTAPGTGTIDPGATPVAPDTTITLNPPAETGEKTATFAFEASPVQDGNAFQCALTGPGQTGIASACTSPKTYTNLTAGDYKFTVTATNGLLLRDLTPATYSWTVTDAPDTKLTGQPAPTTAKDTASFGFAANPSKPGDSFSCNLSGPSQAHAMTSCTSPKTYGDLAPGTYTFKVMAKNGTLEDATPATYTWTVKPLDTKLTTKPAATTDASTATFAFTADPAETGDTYSCSLSGPSSAHALRSCSSPVSYSNLEPGDYTFSVKAALGTVADATPATYTWTVSKTPWGEPTAGGAPETKMTGGPANFGWLLSTVTGFKLTSSEPGIFRCKLDGKGYAPCGNSPSVTLRNLGQQTHVFTGAAVDLSGNADATPATRTFTVPRNNTTLTHSAGWSQRNAKGYFLNSFSQTTKKGATLRYKAAGIKRVALVASKGRGNGTVQVFLGKTLLKKVSLNATRTQHKRVISVASFATKRRGTITVKVVSSGKVVQVEGLGIASR